MLTQVHRREWQLHRGRLPNSSFDVYPAAVRREGVVTVLVRPPVGVGCKDATVLSVNVVCVQDVVHELVRSGWLHSRERHVDASADHAGPGQ